MPSAKQIAEREENISAILSFIRANGPKSRRELSNSLSLSWGCVSELCTILINKGIVLEKEIVGTTSKGRRPTVLELNHNICFLGVDINIMGLSACVCNLLGEKVYSLKGKFNYNTKTEFIESVASFVNSVLKDRSNIYGIGFAMQGIFDEKTSSWRFPSNDVISINFNLDFDGVFKIPFVVEHDPNCILYGCFDKNEGSKMILRLDSGIGAAVYKNNAFLKDELLEIGYFVINENGDRLHKIVSLSAIEKITQKAELNKYLKYAGKCLGIVLGNICSLFKLDEIYLCGDLVSKCNIINSSFYEFYQKTAINSYIAKVITVEATDAAYGAAKIAMEKLEVRI